jgi:hypothetical protein
LKEGDNYVNLAINGKMILKWMLKKMWEGVKYINPAQDVTSGGLL